MSRRDRRLVIIVIWLAIAAGSAAVGELAYLLIRWIVG